MVITTHLYKLSEKIYYFTLEGDSGGAITQAIPELQVLPKGMYSFQTWHVFSTASVNIGIFIGLTNSVGEPPIIAESTCTITAAANNAYINDIMNQIGRGLVKLSHNPENVKLWGQLKVSAASTIYITIPIRRID